MQAISFTDIEGSTRLWGITEAMGDALARYDASAGPGSLIFRGDFLMKLSPPRPTEPMLPTSVPSR